MDACRGTQGHFKLVWSFGKVGSTARADCGSQHTAVHSFPCTPQARWVAPLAAPCFPLGDTFLIAYKNSPIVCSWSKALCAQHLPQAEILF